MTTKIAVFLLCASLLPATQVLAKSHAILPDGCGDDSIEFDAKQENVNPAFVGPGEGKALIVFVESMPGEYRDANNNPLWTGWAWAGATKGDSYFSVEIAPGEHNLCASMQSAPSNRKKEFSHAASFTAEAGKVYFFRSRFSIIPTPSLDFSPLSEAEGKYRLKAWKFATSKPKK